MKKSLVALAVLAASGASFAQSVTLYGLADVWFGSNKHEDGVTGTSHRQTKIDSGGVNTSRWGLKGSEDLGGGLKANFKLEQGFKMDTGAAGSSTGQGTTGTQAFDRQSWVGFSGGFGEVQIGKTWSAYDDVSGASNALFDSPVLAPLNYVFKSVGYIDRPINGIRYSTPEFSGFSGAISYSTDEKVAGAAKVASLNVSYGAGPLNAHLGYQVEDVDNSAAGSADAKFTRLGASYDFGVATAKATYGKVANVDGVSGKDADEYQLGVDVPVSAALTVSASYAKSDDSNAGFEQARKGYGIGASYTLSKRTFLYGGYESDTATNNAAADSKHSLFAVGVQHRF